MLTCRRRYVFIALLFILKFSENLLLSGYVETKRDVEIKPQIAAHRNPASDTSDRVKKLPWGS